MVLASLTATANEQIRQTVFFMTIATDIREKGGQDGLEDGI